MIALSFDADSVKNYSLMAMGGSFVGLLLVLKFAKSIVSKLLLLIVCVGIGVLAFTQRDAVNACIATANEQAQTQDNGDGHRVFLCTLCSRIMQLHNVVA
jgi:hypothetical protein